MNILISNVVLRACAAVALASALLGCAHQASTISVNKQQDPVRLSAIEFLFVPVEFSGVGHQPELHKVGYYSGQLASDLARSAKSALMANGIEATTLTLRQANATKPQAYRLQVMPTSLKIVTNEKYGTSYSTMELEVSLLEPGRGDVLWKGKRVVDLRASDRRSRDVQFGDMTLAVLNELKSSDVLALPQGYAVSPKGNRSYVLDY